MTLPAELRAEAIYLRSLIPEAVYLERRESLERQAALYDRAADALECEGPTVQIILHNNKVSFFHASSTKDVIALIGKRVRLVEVDPLPATPEGV